MQNLIFTTHISTTLAMTGLIWFVQIIHYPLFHQSDHSRAFFKANTNRTGFVVIPLMLTEITTAALLLLPALKFPASIAIINLILLLLTWLATALLSAPCHRNLVRTGYNSTTVNRLVATNWVRTVLWTSRTLILLANYPFQQS
jgi:hypothetical protein